MSADKDRFQTSFFTEKQIQNRKKLPIPWKPSPHYYQAVLVGQVSIDGKQ